MKKIIWTLFTAAISVSAFAATPVQVCTAFQDHYSFAPQVSCAIYTSDGKFRDPRANDICLELALHYGYGNDGAQALACLEADSGKNYTAEELQTCKSIADQSTNNSDDARAVECLQQSGSLIPS
jgi:hypothetical protein